MKKKAWIVTFVAVFGGISLAFLQNKVSPIVTVLMDVFHISMNTAGLLSSIFSAMGIIIAIPAAMIIQKLGPKMAGVASFVVAIIGTIIGVLTTNVNVLIVSRVIEGMGVGIIAVLVPSLISMWFPPEKRGFPMGLWGSWMTISSSMVFLICGPISNAFSWKGLWWFGLIMCVISLVLFLLFVEEPPADSNFDNVVEEENVSIKDGMKSKSAWILAIAALLFAFCSFSFGNWIAPFWSKGAGWSLETAQKWIALLYFVEIFFAVLVGFILDRVKNRVDFGAIGFIFYGVVGFLAFTVQKPIFIMILVFVFPIFDALVPSVFWTIGPQTASSPKYTGIALAILNIGLNTGTLLSGPLTGWLIEGYGWNSLAYMFILVCLIGAFFTHKIKLNFE